MITCFMLSIGWICRNPLHAVAGAARFLMEDCSPTSRMYEDVSTIASCATQMSNLITALVDWTGVNSSAGEATLTAVDVLSLCTNVVSRCSSRYILAV